MSENIIQRAPNAYAYPLLIKHLLHTPQAAAQDQEIVYADVMRYRYRDLLARIHRLAGALAGLGVQSGQTVAVMDWDSHRYLECFFAVPMMGAVLQTVNVRLSHEQIAYTLNHAQADVVLVNRDFLPIIADIAQELKTVKTYVLMQDEDFGEAQHKEFAGEYEALLAAADEQYDFPDFDENTRATTFYTTGTTGLPKGVYFSHRQLVLHTLAVTAALALAPKQGGLHRDDVYMPITPMFHVHAWGIPYVATAAGVKQVYPGRYLPEKLLALKAAEKVTFSHCVPTILQMLLTHPDAEHTDLSGWKMVIGGSALSAGLAQAAAARGMDVFTGYGMSETCPILSLAQLPEHAVGGEYDIPLRCKTGLPVPLVDLRTVDGQMHDCPHDGETAGEVVVRAPWLTQGYLHDQAQSEILWEGGYLHTQDIGHINAQGWLQITDRIKDVIKTGGEWVSSLDLENLISTHPAVAEVAVIAVTHEKWGERPMALVVPKPGVQADAADIRKVLEDAVAEGKISRYGIIERIEFVSELEKTSVGKLNKKAMRAHYSA